MRAAPPLHPIPIKEASFNNSRYRKLQLVKIQRITDNEEPSPSRGYIYNTIHL